MSVLIQSRYTPGTTLAEVMGEEWEDIYEANPGFAPERVEAFLASLRETFDSKEWRAIPADEETKT